MKYYAILMLTQSECAIAFVSLSLFIVRRNEMECRETFSSAVAATEQCETLKTIEIDALSSSRSR